MEVHARSDFVKNCAVVSLVILGMKVEVNVDGQSCLRSLPRTSRNAAGTDAL